MNNNLPRNRSQASLAGAQCPLTPTLQCALAARLASRWILIMATLAVAMTTFGAESHSSPSLQEAAGELLIGVGLHDRIPERPMDWPLLLSQFSSVTPENSMKPDPVQRVEGQFRFDLPDAFVTSPHPTSSRSSAIAWSGPRTIALRPGSIVTERTSPVPTCSWPG
jgi:hypothetical protein